MTRIALLIVATLLIAGGVFLLIDTPHETATTGAVVPPASVEPDRDVPLATVSNEHAPTPLALDAAPTDTDASAAPEPEPSSIADLGPPPSFKGRVVDESGAPVERARVSGYVNGAYQRSLGTARTNADGAFATKTAPPGMYDLQIVASKLDMHYVSDLRITTPDTIDVGTIVLVPASTLTGRVIDEHGQPVPELPLEAHHGTGSGLYAKTATDAAGNFEVFLPESVPYVLEIDTPGWEHWESDGAFVPNSTGLVIEAKSITTETSEVTMIVSDAESGAPITDFAVTTWQHSPSASKPITAAPDTTAPHGRRVVRYDPTSYGWRVDAPGYSATRGRSEPGQREVFVELKPEARVVGRIVSGDAPLVGVRVDLNRRLLNAKETYDTWDTWEFDLDDFEGRTRRVTTNEAGEFAFSQLSGGTYILHATPPDAPPILVDNLALEARATTDLGNLAPPAWARIEGRVVLPPGVPPGGLAVTAHGPGRDERPPVPIDEAGAFAIEKVTPSVPDHAPGESGYRPWRLTVAPLDLRSWVSDPRFGTEPFLPSGNQPVATPHAGQTAQVTLDLRERMTCERAVFISAGGQPVDGVRVAPIVDGKPIRSTQFHRTTDSAGMALLRLPCDNAPTLQLTSDRNIPLGDHALPPGPSEPAAHIDLPAGRLVLILPQPLTGVPTMPGTFTHWPAAGSEKGARPMMAGTKAWRREAIEGATRVDVGVFPAGSWGVRLRVGDASASGTATVSPGVTTEVALTKDG